MRIKKTLNKGMKPGKANDKKKRKRMRTKIKQLLKLELKKEKEKTLLKSMCNLHMRIFVLHPLDFLPPSFLPNLVRKLFNDPSGLHHYFSLSPSQSNTLQKIFPPLFFFFFIFSKIHSTKHTLKLFEGSEKIGKINTYILTRK